MILRPLEPEDLALLYTLENDPELWDSANSDAPYSRYALKQYIAHAQPLHACGELRLVIEVAGEAGRRETVGAVDLTSYNALAARAEVGIAILAAFRHKGYGEEALRMLEELVRSRYQIHSFYAHTAESNAAAIQLFKQSGYTQVARLTDWVFRAGRYEAALLFQKIL